MTELQTTCPLCGTTSANPNDIREGFCGSCHAFTQHCTFWPRCKDEPVKVYGNIALCQIHSDAIGEP